VEMPSHFSFFSSRLLFYKFLLSPFHTLLVHNVVVLWHGTSFPMPAALPQVAFFLLSLGILEGFFHVRWVCSRNKEKNYLFVNFACFGVVKVA